MKIVKLNFIYKTFDTGNGWFLLRTKCIVFEYDVLKKKRLNIKVVLFSLQLSLLLSKNIT